MKEILHYDRAFPNIRTIGDFYRSLGLLKRLDNGEIHSVSRILLGPEDHGRLHDGSGRQRCC